MPDYKKYLEVFEECLRLDDLYINTGEGGSFYYIIDGNNLKIFFQWSASHSDWLNNFDFPKQAYKDTKLPWKVHRGFLRVFKSIEPYIKNAIMDSRVKNIEIVGYSHGAPLAALCHEYCIYNRPECAVTGYGFGSPRLLYGKYPQELLDRWKNFTVIKNPDDIVSWLPPWCSHVGQVVDLSPKGYYIKSEKKFLEKFKAGHRPQNIIKQLENKISEDLK